MAMFNSFLNVYQGVTLKEDPIHSWDFIRLLTDSRISLLPAPQGPRLCRFCWPGPQVVEHLSQASQLLNCGERLENMFKAGMKLKHLWNKSSNNASKWRNTQLCRNPSLASDWVVDLRAESAASASFPSHEWFRQVPSKSSMNGTDGTIPIWNHQTDWRWSHDDFSFIWFHTPKSPICPTDWRTWQSTGGPPKQSTPLGHGEVCFNGPTHHFPFSWLGVLLKDGSPTIVRMVHGPNHGWSECFPHQNRQFYGCTKWHRSDTSMGSCRQKYTPKAIRWKKKKTRFCIQG